MDLYTRLKPPSTSPLAAYPHTLHILFLRHRQVAPADFAQNMDLVTERTASKPGTLSTLFGPVAPVISQSLGAATAADQVAIEKAAKWYRGAACTYYIRTQQRTFVISLLIPLNSLIFIFPHPRNEKNCPNCFYTSRFAAINKYFWNYFCILSVVY